MTTEKTDPCWRWSVPWWGCCAARRTSGAAGLQSDRTWRLAAACRGGWSVVLDWHSSPHCPTLHLVLQVVVQPQQSVVGSDDLRDQPGLLVTGDDQPSREDTRTVSGAAELTAHLYSRLHSNSPCSGKVWKYFSRIGLFWLDWWESHVLDFLRSLKPKQTMKLWNRSYFVRWGRQFWEHLLSSQPITEQGRSLVVSYQMLHHLTRPF